MKGLYQIPIQRYIAKTSILWYDLFSSVQNGGVTLGLLTRDIAADAIRIALPAIVGLCAEATSQPKGVVIAIAGKGLPEPFTWTMEELGSREKWELDFHQIALEKLLVSSRTGRASRKVIDEAPWLLEAGDSLYQGAVAEDAGLAVSVSGSYSQVDEAIAWMVFNIIFGLCHIKLRVFQDREIASLP
ncbi:MAG: hypothetical protein Q7S63_01850 [bacterium]|nr:hypothetical protein [bacterium]